AAFAVALVGGVHDLFTKRVPNWLTIPAVLAGVGAHLFFFGWESALWSLAGALLPFAALWPVYAAGWAGAGDVKLLMAVGAVGGFTFGWQVTAAAFAGAGVWGFFDVLFRGRLVHFSREMLRFLKSVATPGMPVAKPALDAERKASFGIFVAIAAVGVILWGHYGAA
ncbi:MAG: prepilin peptidase, partial [Bdellovibrionales bacterium]|nr:prepilin peptidase [Bdellovibrionales bacterium]